VQLSNTYAATVGWDDKSRVRKVMNEALENSRRCSWIGDERIMHLLLVRNSSHSQFEEIYNLLDNLDGKMKEFGYVPNTNYVLHDVEKE
jgi:hypothetical protein